jgi:hypothetical protein
LPATLTLVPKQLMGVTSIMTDDTEINKSYVHRYLETAQSTESEAVKNDCLYRVGSHMEVLPCDGNANLTQEQQQQVIDAAQNFLGGQQ